MGALRRVLIPWVAVELLLHTRSPTHGALEQFSAQSSRDERRKDLINVAFVLDEISF